MRMLYATTFWVSMMLASGSVVWADGGHAIELDLNQTFGDGPDHGLAQVGDTVEVWCWVTHDPACSPLAQARFSIHSKHADFLSYIPATCYTTSWEPSAPNIWTFTATVFCFITFSPPWLHGIASYQYTGPGNGRLNVVEPLTWLDHDFLSGTFTNNIGATFGPTTTTESSSWSQVKGLFR